MEWKTSHELDVFRLNRIFTGFDDDRSGCLTYEKFRRALNNDEVLALMGAMDLHVQDARFFFQTLLRMSDGGKGDVASFVDSCLRFKQRVTGLDVQRLIVEARTQRQEFGELKNLVQ